MPIWSIPRATSSSAVPNSKTGEIHPPARGGCFCGLIPTYSRRVETCFSSLKQRHKNRAVFHRQERQLSPIYPFRTIVKALTAAAEGCFSIASVFVEQTLISNGNGRRFKARQTVPHPPRESCALCGYSGECRKTGGRVRSAPARRWGKFLSDFGLVRKESRKTVRQLLVSAWKDFTTS